LGVWTGHSKWYQYFISPQNQLNNAIPTTTQNENKTEVNVNTASAASLNDNIKHKQNSQPTVKSVNFESNVGNGNELRKLIKELDKEIEQKKSELATNSGIAFIDKDKQISKSGSEPRIEKELESLETQRTHAKQKLID